MGKRQGAGGDGGKARGDGRGRRAKGGVGRDGRRAGAEGRTVALITGASAGIGRELALVFAEHGHDLVLVARSGDKLEELAAEVRWRHGRIAEVMTADLTATGAPRRLCHKLAARGVSVEILVNNAGVGVFKPFRESDYGELAAMIQLNIAALTELTHLLLPAMIERGHGRVLNVASVTAFCPMPLGAVYAATKAFVLSLTEALAEELSGSGVSVGALCPGAVDTDLARGASVSLGHEQAIPSFLLLDPTSVARQGYEACMAGDVVRVNGRLYEAAVQWMRLQPRWLLRRVLGFAARRLS